MATPTIGRILVYTHNSIGLGHAFRTLAVITGIRKWRPDIDFLVLSGTSVPHVFMRQGIEVVKLPGVQKAIGQTGSPLKPRYLKSVALNDVLRLRRTIIGQALGFFKPEVVMVEHYLAGLAGEIAPLLRGKKACRATAAEFALVHLSRGIMGNNPSIRRPGPGSSAGAGDLYDFQYVFDDPGPDRPAGNRCPAVRYLGKMTDKTRAELPDRAWVVNRLRLADAPVILISLSRHGDIRGLSLSLLAALERAGLSATHQVIMVVDPYLDPGVAADLRSDARLTGVRFLPFFYPLIDLIHAADIVICRAGYNVINEVLLTDTKALVIPEHHGGAEQEQRAGLLPRDNIVVLTESEVLKRPPAGELIDLAARHARALGFAFDKYAIGKAIIGELESWLSRRRGGPVRSC